uniref:YggS family pyridoxal phosphate-dependent enzyme n=1 Tax=Flavobacterium sp. TaxID=239 RepID=UPI004049082A
MSIQHQIASIKKSIPNHVTLVAVSKTKPNEALLEAYEAGQRVYGENKVQEMVAKQEALPKDIQWHMIGHLQSNKVKYMASFVALIHGVDSLKLLKEINKQAAKNDRIIDCLLQVHIAEEETKFGFDAAELQELIAGNDLKDLQNIRIVGLMGMATFTDDEAQIKKEFQGLKALFDSVFMTSKLPNVEATICSMGMSNDYEIAIEAGSTMIRVGSKIFGSRD